MNHEWKNCYLLYVCLGGFVFFTNCFLLYVYDQPKIIDIHQYQLILFGLFADGILLFSTKNQVEVDLQQKVHESFLLRLSYFCIFIYSFQFIVSCFMKAYILMLLMLTHLILITPPSTIRKTAAKQRVNGEKTFGAGKASNIVKTYIFQLIFFVYKKKFKEEV